MGAMVVVLVVATAGGHVDLAVSTAANACGEQVADLAALVVATDADAGLAHFAKACAVRGVIVMIGFFLDCRFLAGDEIEGVADADAGRPFIILVFVLMVVVGVCDNSLATTT